jgi:hypothetical protein
MAEVAAWRLQFGGISYGGSGNAYTATNNAVGTWSAYAAGDFIGLLANHTNTGAATINVDGLGAKNIVTNDGGALIAGDLTSGALVLLLYDGTSFQLVGSFASGSYQPLDATLTALAGVRMTHIAAGAFHSGGWLLGWVGLVCFLVACLFVWLLGWSVDWFN